ncbi:MAG: aminotransferase class V-fold PLP-dependent enzyme [Ferruginibacter sp.]|nr:aminotransferase class V-fold PLP-dependent enzyme [Ferruginibacter sp.]
MQEDDLINLISQYEIKSAELEINLSKRKEINDIVAKFTNDFIERLPYSKSFINKNIQKERLEISGLPHSLEELLLKYSDEVIETGIKPASGGHIGYIPGGGIFAGAIGDFLAAVSNVYAGVSFASPGAVAIENEVINWLKKIFGFPQNAVGNLASGGSVSNLIALAAARDKFQIKNDKVITSVIYLTTQSHHCIQKALRIIGLEDVIIRYVTLDNYFKMDTMALKQQIETDLANDLNPFLIIASAGTTDVGAIDPLDEIAGIAKRFNLWFHVDAAYGGFFIMTSKKDLFKGIEQADSLVVDPHKGMFLPYGIGAVLIKDASSVLHANHYSGNYMQDAVIDDLAIDPANLSPELTKHFRGLRMWLPLQLHGEEPFIACLEEKLLLTEYFRQKLLLLGFKVGPAPDLSVSYFWYPASKDANKFNRTLMQNIHKDGSVFLSSTLIDEHFVIRMAILSFRTKRYTIDKAIDMIKSALESTKHGLA